MSENLLIPLPGFELPFDLPEQVGFVSLVDHQLRLLRATGHFLPPRFFGYFVEDDKPVGAACSWTVTLDEDKAVFLRLGELDKMILGAYSIRCALKSSPEFLLVHDRWSGECWLWSYFAGMRFVESVDPVFGGPGDEQESNLPKPEQ